MGCQEAKMVAGRRVHSEDRRLDDKFDGLDKYMDIMERLVAVESRVRELEAKR